jgi:hypothetical protein
MPRWVLEELQRRAASDNVTPDELLTEIIKDYLKRQQRGPGE